MKYLINKEKISLASLFFKLIDINECKNIL